MVSDETIRKVVRVILETEELEQGHTCDVYEDRLIQYARALAEAGLLTPAPLTEEIETDRLMQFGGPVAVIERRRRWVTDWEAIE